MARPPTLWRDLTPRCRPLERQLRRVVVCEAPPAEVNHDANPIDPAHAPVSVLLAVAGIGAEQHLPVGELRLRHLRRDRGLRRREPRQSARAARARAGDAGAPPGARRHVEEPVQPRHLVQRCRRTPRQQRGPLPRAPGPPRLHRRHAPRAAPSPARPGAPARRCAHHDRQLLPGGDRRRVLALQRSAKRLVGGRPARRHRPVAARAAGGPAGPDRPLRRPRRWQLGHLLEPRRSPASGCATRSTMATWSSTGRAAETAADRKKRKKCRALSIPPGPVRRVSRVG